MKATSQQVEDVRERMGSLASTAEAEEMCILLESRGFDLYDVCSDYAEADELPTDEQWQEMICEAVAIAERS